MVDPGTVPHKTSLSSASLLITELATTTSGRCVAGPGRAAGAARKQNGDPGPPGESQHSLLALARRFRDWFSSPLLPQVEDNYFI